MHNWLRASETFARRRVEGATSGRDKISMHYELCIMNYFKLDAGRKC